MGEGVLENGMSIEPNDVEERILAITRLACWQVDNICAVSSDLESLVQY